MSFIPPQLYARFNELSRLTYLQRKENTDLKTQIRLGENDLMLLVKFKGEKDWTVKDINVFGELPPVELFKNWPNKPMPEISSPAKGRLFLRRQKTTHHLSSSSSAEDSSPPAKQKGKVARISRDFEQDTSGTSA